MKDEVCSMMMLHVGLFTVYKMVIGPHFPSFYSVLSLYLSLYSDFRLSYNMTQAGSDVYQPGNIRMTLENSDLWKSFHSVGTEMIITKHGR